MKPSEFLIALWGPKPAGRLALWRLRDKKSFYPLAPIGADALAAGKTDIYTAVALCWPGAKLDQRSRPSAAHAVALPGLWLDIDVTGEQGLALCSAYVDPTIVVATGGGYHAWHLFTEPWVFSSRDDQATASLLAARWQQLHREEAERQGFRLDATHDLARLMRLPGTLNGKQAEPRPVEIVTQQGRPRHVRARLSAACGGVRVAAPSGPAAQGGGECAPIAAGRALDDERLAALMENSPELDAAWRHEGGAEHWSLSEWDLCIAGQLARAEWDDQAIADAIAAHRRAWGDERKGAREDYVRRTITRARSGGERGQAAATLAELAAAGRRAV